MKKIMLTAAATSMLAAGPVMAAEDTRASAPAKQASQLEASPILAVAALAGFVLAIVLVADEDDDEPISV